VTPDVYFRAEHLGSRATPAIVPRALRGRTHRGHRCAQDGISWFEVHSRQPRLHGSRIGGTRSSAATSRTELRPKPAWSGTRSRYDGGRSATSLNTSVLGGKPMGAPAYPTDRMLGGAEPGRSSPRSMGFRWRHQELAHGRVGRGRGSFRTSHHGPSASVVAGGLPPLAYRLHGPRFSGGARVGCRVHPGACIQVCFGARQAGRLPTFELAQRRREGSVRAGGNIGEVSGRSVRSCRSPCGEWHASLVKLCTRGERAREGGCGGSPHQGQPADSRPRRSEKVKAGVPNQYGC
jgi:hypothetical protein